MAGFVRARREAGRQCKRETKSLMECHRQSTYILYWGMTDFDGALPIPGSNSYTAPSIHSDHVSEENYVPTSSIVDV